MRPPEQINFPIDGMKPPDVPDNERCKTKIYAWLDRKVNQKRATEETRTAHAEMIATIEEEGFDWHPYTDPSSGRQRRVNVVTEKKAKTAIVVEIKPKRGRGRKRGGPSRDDDVIIAPEAKEDTKVESRRVPRKSVEKEIDPFGVTRAAMKKPTAKSKKGAKRK